MSENLVIHIGLPKSGTTFLQKKVFPNFKDYSFFRGGSHMSNVLSAKNKKILISEESFIGNIYSGNWKKELIIYLDNLKLLYGNPKIIIGFRKQNSFILSLYKQKLHQKGFDSFESFYSIDNKGLIKVEELLFSNVLNEITERFDKVFVYTQEYLLKDYSHFISNLELFLDSKLDLSDIKFTRENVGVSSIKQVEKLIYLNKLNFKLENIHRRLSLYSYFLYRMKLTPRQICTNTKNNIGDKFILNDNLNNFMINYYKKDWLNIETKIGVQ